MCAGMHRDVFAWEGMWVCKGTGVMLTEDVHESLWVCVDMRPCVQTCASVYRCMAGPEA